MPMKPSEFLCVESCQPVAESKVAFSLKTSGSELVEPWWTSIETSFTARLGGVPVHVGGVALVVVFAGPKTQVQVIAAPTQYVFPSEPVSVPPLSAPGVSDVNGAWR